MKLEYLGEIFKYVPRNSFCCFTNCRQNIKENYGFPSPPMAFAGRQRWGPDKGFSCAGKLWLFGKDTAVSSFTFIYFVITPHSKEYSQL